MILLLWENNFEYKNSILLSDVCYDLSLLWQLPKGYCIQTDQNSQNTKKIILLAVFCSYHIYSQGTNVLYTPVYICLQPCTGMVSGLLPFKDNMTCLYHFRFISIAIALQRCIIYVQGLFFNADSTIISIY